MLTTIISRFGGIRKVKDFDLSDFICIIGLLAVSIGMAAIYVFILHPEDNPTLTSYPLKVKAVEVREVEDIPEVKPPVLTDEEIMAKVVNAEAKGERLLGQVLVAYTILNRCDYYGKTVELIVKEPNQYSYDESIKPTDTNYRAVIIAELIKDFIPDLLPDTLMWFANDGYHKGDHCGEPYIQVGKHYFNYLPESEE